MPDINDVYNQFMYYIVHGFIIIYYDFRTILI